jgi:hypothetical protein
MATSWDMNELYKFYLGRGYDKKTAAQYVAYQYLASPTGSVSTLKEPEKYYTLDQYYELNAPSYSSVINFKGDISKLDPLQQYTIKSLQPYKGKSLTLNDISRIARQAAKAVSGNAPIDGEKIDVQDYYNQLKDLYAEKTAAEKSFKVQKDTHPYAQFGLGDPNLRYTVYTKPTDPTAGSSFAGRDTVKFDPSKYVQYKPAVDYIAKATSAFGNNINATIRHIRKTIGNLFKAVSRCFIKSGTSKIRRW